MTERIRRLMIVDDSNIIRRKIERAQDLPAITVVGSAKNGMEAVELFQRIRPDLVTMDITMPEMDGIECVEALVQMDPQVRILVISALADKSTAIDALEKGACGFLCKPFTERQLNDALTTLIQS
jgi:two-component system, chemotaxis family, chemotaxis protein CheY